MPVERSALGSPFGTSRLEHLRQNAEQVAKGPLPAETVAAIRAAFRAQGTGWEGKI